MTPDPSGDSFVQLDPGEPLGSDEELESEEMEESGPLPGDDEMDSQKPTAENDSNSDMDYLAMLRNAGVPRAFGDYLDEVEALLKITDELGGLTEPNVDECIKNCWAIVSEIYSPPRVTKAAEMLSKLNIDPGLAMDLTTEDELGNPWDFSKEHNVCLLYTSPSPRDS